MPTSFLDLPAELRYEICKYLPGRGEIFCPLFEFQSRRKKGLVPSLLSTNKTILHEARAVLYGHNSFDLTWHLKDVSEFFDSIGLINASHLRRISIRFPILRETGGDVTVWEDDLRELEKIQSYCTNLKTIHADVSHTLGADDRLYSFYRSGICDKALALVDAHFRAIPSLSEIVVVVPKKPRSLEVTRKMQSRGWRLVRMDPCIEEEDDDDGTTVD